MKTFGWACSCNKNSGETIELGNVADRFLERTEDQLRDIKAGKTVAVFSRHITTQPKQAPTAACSVPPWSRCSWGRRSKLAVTDYWADWPQITADAWWLSQLRQQSQWGSCLVSWLFGRGTCSALAHTCQDSWWVVTVLKSVCVLSGSIYAA